MTDIETTAPRRSGLLRYIFIGDEGVRAGWSLLLFCVLTFLFFALAGWIDPPKPPLPGTPQTPGYIVENDALLFIVPALAAFLVSLVERRPFERYGLRRVQMLPDLLRGMAWGLAMLSLLIGMLAVTGAWVFDGFALRAGAALEYAGLWFLGFLLVGLAEEFLTRGFLQYTVARGVAGIVSAISPSTRWARTIGFWVAAAIFSVALFAAGHIGNKGESPMGFVSVALAGLTFVYVLYRTGSLWWAIGFHTTWDWAQSYLYGTPDSGLLVQGHLIASRPAGAALLSGGATGPEGSIFVIPTLLLTCYIIHRTLPRRASAFNAWPSGNPRAQHDRHPPISRREVP